MRVVRRAATPGALVLGVILVAGLLLRLWNIDHGLPYLYHPDEAYHYTSRAMLFFGGTLDPRYFQNPSAFTYLTYAALRLVEGGGWPFRNYHAFVVGYARDPTEAFVVARTVAAVLCMLGVAATYAAARRLWGVAEAIGAAAVLTFAFLTVAYSRYAVTDVGVLLPSALAVYGAIMVREDGRLRWYLLAGAATGLAIGFKYTAGLVLLLLLGAALLRFRDERDRRTALRRIAAALAVMTAAFVVTTPFFVIDLHVALYQLKIQRLAANTPKLGQPAVGGIPFYLRSLTWGFGWGGLIAAGVGFVLQWRRDRVRALMLVAFPLALLLYFVTDADRFFARWLMPGYPALAMLAGVGIAGVARAVPVRPALQAAVLALLVVAAIAMPVAADVRNARVLGREDTRQIARAWMNAHLPPAERVVIEPAVPSGFFGARYTEGFGPRAKASGTDAGSATRFILALAPRRIDEYRHAGYCTVVTMSLIRDRALQGGNAEIAAYYRRLDRESRVVFRASPYRPGAKPVRFDFDFSTHLYEPAAYWRPGPDIAVRRLTHCRQGVGGPAAADGATPAQP
jgi:4-amino-4-deoxy-L-arabinose transferase-like glycosyltransferase